MNLASQNEAVLELLRDRGEAGLTALEALDLVGSMRLSGRIYDLKQQGYDITMKLESTGTGKRIGRYRLTGKRGQQPMTHVTSGELPLAGPPVGIPCPACGAALGSLTPGALDPSFLTGRCRNCRREVQVFVLR